jgi:hypothetical protein
MMPPAWMEGCDTLTTGLVQSYSVTAATTDTVSSSASIRCFRLLKNQIGQAERCLQ